MNDKDWIKNIYLPRLKGKVLYVDYSTTDSLHKYVPNPELFETIDTGDFMGFKREYKYDHISMHSSWGDLMFIKHGAWYENSGSKTKLHRLKLEMTQSIINMVCKAHNMLNEGGTLQMGPILNTPESMDGIYDYLNNNGYHTIFREYGVKKGFYGNYIFWGIKKKHYEFIYKKDNLWDSQDTQEPFLHYKEHFEGWAIQESCFNFIRKILPKGKTILELGSGHGTGALSEYYNMISIENQPEWVGVYNSKYIEVPVKEYSDEYIAPNLMSKEGQYLPGEDEDGNQCHIQKGWYDYEILAEKLRYLKYDLILVDGPNGKIGRGGFLKHLDLFNINVPIIIDDISREGERFMMEEISSILKKPYSLIDENTGIISENIIKNK